MSALVMPQNVNQHQNPARCALWWQARRAVWESPLTGSTQGTYLWGAWRCQMDWELVQREYAAPLIAWLTKAASGDEVQLYDPARPMPRGVARGTATPVVGTNGLVNGAGQTGRQLVTKWSTSTYSQGQTIFQAGDLFSALGTGEVYEVVEDATAGAPSGGYVPATIQVAQYIRTSPADASYICAEYVPFSMRLVEFAEPEVRGYYQYSFRARFEELL